VKNVVITVDGPAGTGKSTVAKGVAARLGFTYLDTGALYRAAAYAIRAARGDLSDDEECGRIVSNTKIELLHDRVAVNGKDITSEIRANHISEAASRAAVHPSVRKALLAIQRSFGEYTSLVAEGRDTGSVVFPDAPVKIFLTASETERAKRRYNELLAKGVTISYEQVLEEVMGRDQRDSTRETSPLVIPEHAIVVDTTHLDIDGVIHKVVDVVRDRLANQ